MKPGPLLELMRLDKPVGIWLVYFPASWAVALMATPSHLWHLQALMLLGAVITRAAGCIVNDLTDRKLDAQVTRTHSRPLASGRVARWQALLLLGGLMLIALFIALTLPRSVFLLALVALPMIAAYPWMKRITWWPQAFLGLTFNLSALFGWLATGSILYLPAFTLYGAAIFWTLGYDTIYAVQDMADDASAGIRSSARALGGRLKPFVASCYGIMIALFIMTGIHLDMGPFYYAGIGAAGLHAFRQIRQLPSSPAMAGTIFRSNQWLGFIVLIGILLDRAV